jgi:hypothetical protein
VVPLGTATRWVDHDVVAAVQTVGS